MKRALAVVLDLVVVGAALALAFVLLGGEVRWKTAVFRITLTGVDRPLQVLALALAARLVAGFEGGLVAAVAASGIPVVGGLAARAEAWDRAARAVYLAYRARVGLCLVGLGLALVLLEAYLRYWPETLPPALGSHVATAYHTGPSGIYRYDADMAMNVMRPHYEREMFFNGYRWHHRTDSLGFRNPEDRPSAFVALLGDSMVYGHGLEEPATVRHQLEAILGRPVANWGIQGGSIHHEYQLLKRFAPLVRPRYALVFFLGNDVDDLTGYLDADAMRTFLRIPVDDHLTPYAAPAPPPRRYLEELYVVRAFEFLWGSIMAAGQARAETADDAWEGRPPFRDNPRLGLAMRVHLRALSKIQDLAAKGGFVFVHVFVYTGYLPDEPTYEEILASYGRRHGIRVLSLRPAFARAMATRSDLFLPGDGHYAPAGARLAAEVVARYIEADRAGRPFPED